MHFTISLQRCSHKKVGNLKEMHVYSNCKQAEKKRKRKENSLKLSQICRKIEICMKEVHVTLPFEMNL
jgi:hypothetical protein